MTAVCALFPGQGSQSVGMGRNLCASFPEAAAVFDEAGDVLGLDVRELCWRSSRAVLAETENAQPALLTCAVAAWRVLAGGGVTAAAAAGHSVGALGALVVAGCLDFGDAVALSRLRGELMAAAPGDGAMCAVLLSPAMPRERVADIAEDCGVDLAADNSARQVVYSGERKRMRRFSSEVGARAKALDVSHAFHSRMMKPVEKDWRAAVERVGIRPPRVPVGLIGRGVFGTDPAAIRADLVASLCAPVRWRQVMAAAGTHPRVALGPARSLTGMERRGAASMRLADTSAAVRAVLAALQPSINEADRQGSRS
ncbi:ACP S-malonyltransferase [Streptomyces thioluteus]|uniref:[acyl-carrier-protein] S-malonyltransferase n=1 Tax=Streptomyces thioluteus TaxID=66431 RepID=A0ABN3WRC2_STRTU